MVLQPTVSDQGLGELAIKLTVGWGFMVLPDAPEVVAHGQQRHAHGHPVKATDHHAYEAEEEDQPLGVRQLLVPLRPLGQGVTPQPSRFPGAALLREEMERRRGEDG